LRKLCIDSDLNLNYKEVSNLKFLNSLSIGYSYSDNTGLSLLTNLTSLFLIGENNFKFEDIKHLTKLSTFHFPLSTFIDEICLSSLPFLTNIRINSKIGNSSLRKLTSLSSIIIDRKRTSDKGISALTNLTLLNINDNTHLSNNGIKNLIKLESLLKCKRSKISRSGIINLRKLKMVPELSSKVLKRKNY